MHVFCLVALNATPTIMPKSSEKAGNIRKSTLIKSCSVYTWYSAIKYFIQNFSYDSRGFSLFFNFVPGALFLIPHELGKS